VIRIISKEGRTSIEINGQKVSAQAVRFEHDSPDALPTLSITLINEDVEIGTDMTTLDGEFATLKAVSSTPDRS
jgi:hypothetical protein